MVESYQHRLDRVRPPRVQITYDVEIGDAIVMKELPFVVGVLADLSGMPEAPLPKLRDRKFVEIDRDNFNNVLKAIGPRLVVQVPDRILNNGKNTSMILYFHSLEDFEPLNVVQQIPALSVLYDSRVKLKDMLIKLDGNDELNALLSQVLADPKQLNALATELDLKAPSKASK